MAVDLLTELLFSVTNSLDILKGIFSKFLCIICVNIVTFFIFQSTVCRFAYIEFADKDSVDNAVSLDDSLFKGRQIKVQFFVLEFKVDRLQIILVAKKYISTCRNCSSVGCLKCVQ